jgi:signal transduction histidine kinase
MDPAVGTEPISAWRMPPAVGPSRRSILVTAGIVAACTAMQVLLAAVMLRYVHRAAQGQLADGVAESVAISSCVTTAVLLVIAATAVLKANQRSRARLANVERLCAAGTLAASIAHDIKNPMGIILSTTQVLERSTALGADERALLVEIGEEVRRADDQLNAFLDLVRDMPLKRAHHDLCEIAGSTIDLLASQARRANVRLQPRLPDLPVRVLVDRRRLRQALVNLVLNGIEASGGGTVTIAVDHQGGSSTATLTVEDDGPGIPEKMRRLVLEPFHSTKPNGTGLGLSSAKRIVERHGGTLTLRGGADRGTAVAIELPTGDTGSSGIYRLRRERALAGTRPDRWTRSG